MDWVADLLKLLFGQLGVVGAVCFIGAGHIAYLFHQEREDHRLTRQSLQELIKAQATVNLQFMELLTEVRTYMRMRVNGKDG